MAGSRSLIVGAALTLAACEAPGDTGTQGCDAASGTVDGNLVLDPGFDQGLLCWYVGDEQPGGALQGETDRVTGDADHPPGGDAPSARAANDVVGDSQHTRFFSERFAVVQGETHVGRFYARAEAERTIWAEVNDMCGDQGGSLVRVNPTVGVDWAAYDFTFQATCTTDATWVEFGFGEATGAVWIDDVSVDP